LIVVHAVSEPQQRYLTVDDILAEEWSGSEDADSSSGGSTTSSKGGEEQQKEQQLRTPPPQLQRRRVQQLRDPPPPPTTSASGNLSQQSRPRPRSPGLHAQGARQSSSCTRL